MEDLNKDIKLFVQNYVNALKKIVEEKNQEINSIDIEPNFPTEFPVKVTVFLGNRGLILNFEKADQFEVSIRKYEKPLVRTKWSEFILYPFFKKIKDKASEKAQLEIGTFLALPRMIEEHEQEMEKQYEAEERKYWIEEISYTTEHYVEFLSGAKEVVDMTRKEAMGEVYEMVKVIQNHLLNYEFMILVGCTALDRLYFMINSDLETSLFLALNGKYFAAIAILRKVLEVNIRSIYLDNFPDRTEAEKEIDDWIKGEKLPGKFKQIVDDLISEEIDRALSDLLKKQGTVENGSFKQLILSSYRDLNTYVHLRPQTPWEEDLRFSFSEFIMDKFRSYYALFKKVTKISEILLVLEFPKVISTPGLGKTKDTYTGLILSEHELKGIAKFSAAHIDFR